MKDDSPAEAARKRLAAYKAGYWEDDDVVEICSAYLRAVEALEKIKTRLAGRSSGYRGRGDHIYNGTIMADELGHHVAFVEAQIAALRDGAEPDKAKVREI